MKAGNTKGVLLEYIVRELLKNCGFTNVKADNVFSFERGGLFDVNGRGVSTIQQVTKAGSPNNTTVILTKFTYDDLGRVLKTEKRIWNSGINGGSIPTNWTTVSANEYDPLGQLKKKVLGSNLGSLSYDYNIRGWMLGMNRQYVRDSADNYFGFELGYDKAGTIISSADYANVQYNGNISGMIWKSTGDNEKRKYDYTYDPVNRLLKADFNQFTGGSFNKTAGIDFSALLGNGIVADSAYDYNGNIIKMKQWGLKGFSSQLIDDLIYTYNHSTNKLKNVIDTKNDPNTKFGDFRSSQTYMTALGGNKTNAAVDYTYDENGNIRKDLNKDVFDDTYDGIEYNYLNLPSKIRVKNKGSIEYQYSASGIKLSKTIKEIGKPDKVLIYLNNILYINDTLQYIGQDEGIARPQRDSLLVYDFYIKDHLGNVRAVLTEEVVPDGLYQASMETVNLSIEEQLFSQIPETAETKPGGFDSDTNNEKVCKLFNASSNDRRVGPGVVLKVMAGDKFKAGVKGWYQPGSTNINELPGAVSIVADLINSFTGGLPVGSGHFGGGSTPGSAELNIPLQDFITNSNSPSGSRPKAFLNWILLDEQQFKLVEENYGAVQIPEITGVMKKQTMLVNSGSDIEVKKNGFLYIYVSNESQGNVYFDDLTVTHTRGVLLEETHYYPFGLAMQGIGSRALTGIAKNRIKYNGKEEQRDEFSDGSGLEWLDYGARMYDPQIGRFFTQDRFASNYFSLSPYQYGGNNPIKNIDVNGDSVRTYFYDKEGNLTNTIPEELVKLYREEYGIELGYNSETGMLYGNEISEDRPGDAKISKSAKNDMMNELGAGVVSKGKLIFGYDLGLTDGKSTIPLHQSATDGNNTYIDLADLNSDFSLKNALYPMDFPARSLNLARVIEHDFIGHAIKGLDDMVPGTERDVNPGPVENYVNTYKIEIGVTPRQSYASRRTVPIGPPQDGAWYGTKTDPTNVAKPDPASSKFVQFVFPKAAPRKVLDINSIPQ